MRQWLVFSLRKSGIISLILFLFRKRIPIFMLHGVMDRESPVIWQPAWGRVSRAALDDALKTLCRNYRFVSMNTVEKMLRGDSPVQPYTAALTFDDGYSNNFTHAWPILKKYGAEMTVYVATRYIKEREAFWIDRIDYALHQLIGRRQVHITLNQQPYVFKLIDHRQYREAFTAFRRQIKAMVFADNYEMLAVLTNVAEQLESLSGTSIHGILEKDPWSRPVTIDELTRIDKGIHIGSHTINHIRVTQVNDEQLRSELRDSKRQLADFTGKDCLHFCYPYGDMDDSSRAAVTEAGYLSAVSCIEGTNRVGDDVFKLKRYPFPALKNPQDIDVWLAVRYLKEWLTFS